MVGSQHNGVDATIALLLALAEHNGESQISTLRSEIGTPRASFHRIVQTLAKEGLVEAPRGLLRVGPLAKRLIAANAETVKREDAALPLRGARRQLNHHTPGYWQHTHPARATLQETVTTIRKPGGIGKNAGRHRRWAFGPNRASERCPGP